MLRRLAGYLRKRWDFVSITEAQGDCRTKAQIPTRNVFLSVFLLFANRLGSLNILEQHLRLPRGRRSQSIPSADTIGYCLQRFDLEALRDSLAKMAHQAKRKKSLSMLSVQTKEQDQLVAALDGHELWSSQKRCCEQCCVRTKRMGEGTVQEYYHRVVMLQLVDVWPPLILDFEPVLPQEDEVAASLRILSRVRQRYPRFFKILTLDALYLQRPLMKEAREHGFELIIVLKKEQTTLYREALGLMRNKSGKETKESHKKTWTWDLNKLQSWNEVGACRVIRSAEETTKRERIAGQWSEKTIKSDWMWVTTLSEQEASTATIIRWGHARWDIENRGFNELHAHWAMDHCFHHHPTAIMAFLFILALSFGLTCFFFARNLKAVCYKQKSRTFLARLLCAELSKETLHPFLSRSP